MDICTIVYFWWDFFIAFHLETLRCAEETEKKVKEGVWRSMYFFLARTGIVVTEQQRFVHRSSMSGND